MKKESDAARMLRQQREWQAAKARGEHPPRAVAPKSSRLRWWHIVLAMFVGFPALLLISAGIADLAKSPEERQRAQAERQAQREKAEHEALAKAAAKKKDAERAAAAKIAEAEKEKRRGFHCLSSWDGSNRSVVEQIKARLREPDSFEHVETRIAPEEKGAHALVMTYRAKNGFGGTNVERALATVDHTTCAAEILLTE